MVARIARRELQDILRDGRFRWSAAFVGGLLTVALLTGWSHQRAVGAEHASAERQSRQAWLAQAAKDPHTAAHYGAYAFKPRGPLTLFDTGVNQYAGVAAWLEAHKQNEFQFRPAQDRASVSRVGQLTAAVALQLLIPILIMLLAFGTCAGEREDGTLRQLAATGTPLRAIVIGKAAGVGVALAMVVVPAALLGSVVLVAGADVPVAGETLPRIAGLAMVYTLYFAVFITMSLAVSARAKRSSHALAVLAAFWTLNAVIVPRAASDVSRRLYSTPTAFEFAQRVQHDSYNGLPVHEYNLARARDLRTRLLAQYQVARIEDLPVNFRGVDYLEREAHANEVWDTHYRTLWRAFDHQVQVHHAAGWIAPLMAVRPLSMAWSGVDYYHHRDFAVAAETYRRALVLAMNRDLAYGAGSQNRGAYTADTSLWSTVAPFTYQQPGAGWALAHVWPAGVALMAWLVASVTALAWAVRRMTVE